MAFDQNSIPVDLRPLNLPRTVAEEPRIVTPVTTAVRNIEGLFPNPHRDVCSPMAMPVYYPATISNPGYVGVGFGNVSPGLAFCPRMAAPSANQTPVNPTGGSGYNPNLGEQIGGSAASQASSEGGDDSVSGRKVKFLCSFGGKILPRPSDGMLRYAGGQTRIVSVRRDASFSDLVQKMVDTCGQPVVIKYQLPDEDLDALVSVSCPDDLENMMDEYEKLIERSSDGSCKLRLFLFSASELDSPSTVHLRDFQDGGQRYVDAVNGVLDGFGGGITRKESIASFASTQNSDLSGTDAIESSSTGQGDLNGPPSSSMLSPRTNTASSSDTAPKLVSTELNPSTYATSAGVPLGILPVKSTQPEIERSAPVALQQQPVGLSLEQAGMEIPPLSPYLPSYVDSHSGAIKHTEILQVPPQMGYPNPHVLGTVGSVFNQPQLRDSAASVRPHQYIAVPHMTIAPSSPNIGIESNVVHSLLQPQQTRMENIPKESTFGPRVVPLSGNQGYGAYQMRVTPGVVGGGYAWHQAPASGHVILSDGWVAQQQLMFPEKTQRFEDCYMCQKALPHAHSDTVAQDPRNSSPTSVSDSNTVYHSLQPGDNNRSWLANKAGVTGALGEGSADRHGAGALPRALGHKDNSQNLEAACDGDRIMTQKVDSSDHPVMPVPHGVMGLAGDVQSPYGAFVGTIAQSSQGDTIQPPSVPKHYQVRQDAMLNKPIISDIPPIGGVAYESPKGYSNTPPGIVRKDDLLDSSISHDNQRPINGRMEALHVHDVSNEQNKSYVDMLVKEDILEHRQQQVARGDLLYDDTSVRPKTVLDANQRKAGEMPLYSDSSYLHNLPPVEPYELGRQPIMDSKIGTLHLPSDEACYGNPASSGVDSVHLTDRMAPVTEWKDSTWQFQPNLVPINVENVPSNGRSTILSPIPPTSRYGEGDTQDSPDSLFSIQGPWNYLNDDHRLPPKPNKIMTKRDPVGASENQVGNSGELNSEVQLDDGVPLPQANLNDLSSMHVWSKKGSAEEAIGQELQDVAVDVASSVLQSCLPSHPDLPVYEIDGSISEGNRDVEVQDSDAETKDIKTKHPEKTNIGFPVSDGIGRLQIIKNIDLEELRELGSGTFGTVYHGKWRGTDVAIKRINDRCFVGKPSEQERMRDDFWNEAIKLADLHHPNVVAFYGVVLDGPGGSVATVTEYMVNGSLRTALQKNEKNLDKRKRLLIAMDVAFGMEYLHEKNIVHFDLKSDNLLVNLRDPHRPICKVGDLGLSKVKCQTLISGGVRGTLPWMAPELLNGSSSLVSEKVDVFSFGIVLWELLTGEEPYADLHYGAIIGGIVSNTLRPAVPESCDQEWKSLMERCWSSETSERPNFTDIASQLRSMAAKIPPKGQAQQQQQ